MRYINCGIINYKNKRVVIALNEDFKKDFFLFEDNKLKILSEPFNTELNDLYNREIVFFEMNDKLKKSIASLLLTFSLVNAVAPLSAYADANDQTTNDIVEISDSDYEYLLKNNLFEQVDLNFSIISRGDFCQILFNLNNEKNYQPTSENLFSDVDTSNNNYSAINWASNCNIINGYNGLFNPNDSITKEQLITMLYRYLNYKDVVRIDGVGVNDASAYSNNAIGWAIKNRLCQNENMKSNLSKDDLFNILSNLIIKYNLFKDDINYSNDSILFINSINTNDKLPQSIKRYLSGLTGILNDYSFDKDKINRIVDRFSNLSCETYVKDNNFRSGATASYYPVLNSIKVSENCDYGSVVHEGIHALSTNGDLVGFCDTSSSFGLGLTEGMTQLITSEYSNSINTYPISKNMSVVLTQIIGSDKMMNLFICSDITGLINEIMQIYALQYSIEDSYAKANALITYFDTVYLYDVNKLEKDQELIGTLEEELRNLYEYKFKQNYFDNELMSAYHNKIFNDNYLYYEIETNMFNKNVADRTRIISLTFEDCNDKDVREMMQMCDIQTVIKTFPQILQIEEIGQLKKTL